MKDWVEILMPLLVAMVPVVVTVVKTAQTTRKAARDGIKEISDKLDTHIRKADEAEAKARRVRILRFADDICKGVMYTKEYWSEVLEDISAYQLYCQQNKETFINEKCSIAMEYIKEEYGKALRTNNFMGVE